MYHRIPNKGRGKQANSFAVFWCFLLFIWFARSRERDRPKNWFRPIFCWVELHSSWFDEGGGDDGRNSFKVTRNPLLAIHRSWLRKKLYSLAVWLSFMWSLKLYLYHIKRTLSASMPQSLPSSVNCRRCWKHVWSHTVYLWFSSMVSNCGSLNVTVLTFISFNISYGNRSFHDPLVSPGGP